MPAGISPRSRSTAPSTARRRPRPSPSGRARCPTASSSRSRARATPSTAACSPRPATRIKRFLDSGPVALGDRLGPMLWQFAPTKKFDEADFGAFLELLPPKFDGRKLRHVVEVRHPSFCDAGVRRSCCAASRSRSSMPSTRPIRRFPTSIGDFVYARLQKGKDDDQDRLSAQGARRLGQARRDLGGRRRARRPCPASARRRAPRRTRATSSSTSSTKASCARPPQPRR